MAPSPIEGRHTWCCRSVKIACTASPGSHLSIQGDLGKDSRYLMARLSMILNMVGRQSQDDARATPRLQDHSGCDPTGLTCAWQKPYRPQAPMARVANVSARLDEALLSVSFRCFRVPFHSAKDAGRSSPHHVFLLMVKCRHAYPRCISCAVGTILLCGGVPKHMRAIRLGQKARTGGS